MSDATDSAQPRMNWQWTLALGVLTLVAGLVALFAPVLASFAALGIVAAGFLIGGAIHVVMAFRGEDGMRNRLVGAGLGVLMVVLALLLWANPLAGLVSLTILCGAAFLAMGAVRIWMGITLRQRRGALLVSAAGVLSIGLGLFILVGLPVTALATLGILLGIDLLFSGAALVAFGLASRAA